MIGTRINAIEAVRKINSFLESLDAELYASSISNKKAERFLQSINDLELLAEDLVTSLLDELAFAKAEVNKHPKE